MFFVFLVPILPSSASHKCESIFQAEVLSNSLFAIIRSISFCRGLCFKNITTLFLCENVNLIFYLYLLPTQLLKRLFLYVYRKNNCCQPKIFMRDFLLRRSSLIFPYTLKIYHNFWRKRVTDNSCIIFLEFVKLHAHASLRLFLTERWEN